MHREVLGLIPAGGQATRIAPLPCSKELYPIGFRPVGEDCNLRPKVVCHYLLEKMRLAGVTKAYIVVGEGKWGQLSYFPPRYEKPGINSAHDRFDRPSRSNHRGQQWRRQGYRFGVSDTGRGALFGGTQGRNPGGSG